MDELLFNKYDMYGLVQAQTAAAKKRVQDLPANALLNASEHDLITSVVEEFWMNVPTINDEDIHIAEAGETQVDVRHDPLRAVIDRSRPCLVPGNRTVISVPFTGDEGFFRVQPQTYKIVRRQLFLRRVDSSLLLPNASRCLMKNVTRPNERDAWQIEEATERDNKTGTD